MTRLNHLVAQLAQWPYIRTRLYALALGVLMFMPLSDLVLWRYVYGFINDLSPGTWVLLFVWLVSGRVLFLGTSRITVQTALDIMFGYAGVLCAGAGLWPG